MTADALGRYAYACKVCGHIERKVGYFACWECKNCGQKYKFQNKDGEPTKPWIVSVNKYQNFSCKHCAVYLKNTSRWYWFYVNKIKNLYFGFIICEDCKALYEFTLTKDIIKHTLNKPITSKNYIGIYCSWCNKNGIAPLSFEVLNDVFYGCETNEDFSDTLTALFDIQIIGLQLSFMDKKINKDEQEVLLVRLKLRLELFKRVPTNTNMLLAYELMNKSIENHFTKNDVNIDDLGKSIERFEKCTALALNTKFINERKLAFERSYEIFQKLVNHAKEKV